MEPWNGTFKSVGIVRTATIWWKCSFNNWSSVVTMSTRVCPHTGISIEIEKKPFKLFCYLPQWLISDRKVPNRFSWHKRNKLCPVCGFCRAATLTFTPPDCRTLTMRCCCWLEPVNLTQISCIDCQQRSDAAVKAALLPCMEALVCCSLQPLQ